MPVISMFYGLIVAMYYLDTKQHNLPHIHVKYGEMEAVFQIPEGELLEGRIPSNKEKLIKAWIEIHKEDLMANLPTDRQAGNWLFPEIQFLELIL